MLCAVDPLVHASGTVGTCYTLGDEMVQRNVGEIYVKIGMVLAKGAGFYRVRITDMEDPNLRVFSGLIELTGVIAEGASSAPTAKSVDARDDGSLTTPTVLVVVLGIVSSVMICAVLIVLFIVFCGCILRRKTAADSNEELSESSVRSVELVQVTNPMRKRGSRASRSVELVQVTNPMRKRGSRASRRAARLLTRRKNKNRMFVTCEVSSPGFLGLLLVVETETCQAVVKVAPSATGLVATQNPGVVEAGDVLEAINGESVATITAFDGDGDGAISSAELVVAIKSMGLREIWMSDSSKHAAHAALGDAELARAILAEYDQDGSGELDGEEINSFLDLILRATIGRISALPRDPPLLLTFSRPVGQEGSVAYTFQGEEHGGARAWGRLL